MLFISFSEESYSYDVLRLGPKRRTLRRTATKLSLSRSRSKYGISPENIILYGQSIGTVPTVDLASRYEVGAVVLHSALMSGMRVAFPQTKRTWFFDAFPRFVIFLVASIERLI